MAGEKKTEQRREVLEGKSRARMVVKRKNFEREATGDGAVTDGGRRKPKTFPVAGDSSNSN